MAVTPRPNPSARPTITLSHEGLNVRGVSDFDIETGGKFRLTVDNPPVSLTFEDWFFNNDPVLYANVSEDGHYADIEVRGEGRCKVDVKGVYTVQVMVYPQRAAGFSVSAGQTELKTK